ncbi:MAG: hypothetical protein AAF560_28720 [Acidobacteriota bacterium]
MHRVSFVPTAWMAALGALLSIPTSAQIPTPSYRETLDARTPLELSSGVNEADGTIIVSALFENATRISAFVGPDHGMGPWVEEVAEPPGPTGETFFALSRRTVCTSGTCRFSAVNGATNDIELFTRDAMGVWSRSILAGGGTYFNSDLGLNDGALTALGYDASARTLRVFTAPLPDVPGTPPTFSVRNSITGAADAIFGAMRATLAAADDSSDFFVMYETNDGLPRDASLSRSWYQTRDAVAPLAIGPRKGDGPGTVNLFGDIDGSVFEDVLTVLAGPPSGTPGSLRESSSLLDCGIYLGVRHAQDGSVELAVFGPMGEVFQDFQTLGFSPLLLEGDAPSGFDITKVDDRFPGLPGFWINWPTGAAFVGVEVDTGTVTTIELNRDVIDAPEVGPVLGEGTAEGDVLEVFAGSLVVQVLDPQEAGQQPAEIPALDRSGLLLLFAVLMLSGVGMIRRRGNGT